MSRHLRHIGNWCLVVTVLAWGILEIELRNTASSGPPIQWPDGRGR